MKSLLPFLLMTAFLVACAHQSETEPFQTEDSSASMSPLVGSFVTEGELLISVEEGVTLDQLASAWALFSPQLSWSGLESSRRVFVKFSKELDIKLVMDNIRHTKGVTGVYRNHVYEPINIETLKGL